MTSVLIPDATSTLRSVQVYLVHRCEGNGGRRNCSGQAYPYRKQKTTWRTPSSKYKGTTTCDKIRNDLFFISGSLGKRPESLGHFKRDLELCFGKRPESLRHFERDLELRFRQEGGHGYGPNSSR